MPNCPKATFAEIVPTTITKAINPACMATFGSPVNTFETVPKLTYWIAGYFNYNEDRNLRRKTYYVR